MDRYTEPEAAAGPADFLHDNSIADGIEIGAAPTSLGAWMPKYPSFPIFSTTSQGKRASRSISPAMGLISRSQKERTERRTIRCFSDKKLSIKHSFHFFAYTPLLTFLILSCPLNRCKILFNFFRSKPVSRHSSSIEIDPSELLIFS